MSEIERFDVDLFAGATDVTWPALYEPHALDWYLRLPARLARAENAVQNLASGIEWWKAELVYLVAQRFNESGEGSQILVELEQHLGLKKRTIDKLYAACDMFPDPASRIPGVGPYAHADLRALDVRDRAALAQEAIDASEDPTVPNWSRSDLRARKRELQGDSGAEPRMTRDAVDHVIRQMARFARPGSFGWYEVPDHYLEQLAASVSEPLQQPDSQDVIDV